jgi:uncharacterized protein
MYDEGKAELGLGGSGMFGGSDVMGEGMQILMSGAGGFIGAAVRRRLTQAGHRVTVLTRHPDAFAAGPMEVAAWDPQARNLDRAALEGLDAVIHLAGENIAQGRWTAARKARILKSRMEGTRLLAESLAQCRRPPSVFLCASATGFYGHRGEELLAENSAAGSGFLAEVCRAWEGALVALDGCGTRSMALRFGPVLGPGGGMLKKLLPLYRCGLGGPLGDGRQWLSWIALKDAVRAVEFLLHRDWTGPVNLTAPEPVTNQAFNAWLGRVLHRPARLRVPAFILRGLLGELADEMLLGGQRAVPARLLEAGFEFQIPQLPEALDQIGFR